MMEMDRND